MLNWALPDGVMEAEIHLEFAENGSIKDVLKNVNSRATKSFWHRTGVGKIICGIVLGMRYIHSRGIIHRDLTPSNILLNKAGHPWISDFGTSRNVNETATPTEGSATLWYAAPEMYRAEVKCSTKYDVFSFGSVLYEIVVGKPVFGPLDDSRVIKKRLLGGNLPELPADYGPLLQELLPKCWQQNPRNRPSFKQIFEMFQRDDFAILPGGDKVEVRKFCMDILAWEERAGIKI
jgi:serine/threonine protein kinase